MKPAPVVGRATASLSAATLLALGSANAQSSKPTCEAERDTSGTASPETQVHASDQTQFVKANGICFAYRKLGQADGVPLAFLQHFTGTMDSWDPAVVDGFARQRPVVLFDNAGVSRSSGLTPDNVPAMSQHARSFLAALGLTHVDVLGFSLGGFVAQELAAKHPGSSGG